MRKQQFYNLLSLFLIAKPLISVSGRGGKPRRVLSCREAIMQTFSTGDTEAGQAWQRLMPFVMWQVVSEAATAVHAWEQTPLRATQSCSSKRPPPPWSHAGDTSYRQPPWEGFGLSLFKATDGRQMKYCHFPIFVL